MAAATVTVDSAALGSVAVVGKHMGEAATVAAVFGATLACHRHH